MHSPGPIIFRLLLAAGLALGAATPAGAAQAAPGSAAAVLEPLRVVPGGQEATVDLRASEPVAVRVDYQPVQPAQPESPVTPAVAPSTRSPTAAPSPGRASRRSAPSPSTPRRTTSS